MMYKSQFRKIDFMTGFVVQGHIYILDLTQIVWRAKTVRLKEIVHPQMKIFIIYSPSWCSKPVRVSFLCWTQKKIFWRMLVIKQLMFPIDFHSISFPAMEVNGDQQLFGSSKLFKIYSFAFNIRNKLLRVWNDMRVSKWWENFWVNYPFNLHFFNDMFWASQHLIHAHNMDKLQHAGKLVTIHHDQKWYWSGNMQNLFRWNVKLVAKEFKYTCLSRWLFLALYRHEKIKAFIFYLYLLSVLACIILTTPGLIHHLAENTTTWIACSVTKTKWKM